MEWTFEVISAKFNEVCINSSGITHRDGSLNSILINLQFLLASSYSVEHLKIRTRLRTPCFIL